MWLLISFPYGACDHYLFFLHSMSFFVSATNQEWLMEFFFLLLFVKITTFPNSDALKKCRMASQLVKSHLVHHRGSPVLSLLPQDPRHLQLTASFTDGDVYSLLSARRLHGAPTDYGLCVKVPSLPLARSRQIVHCQCLKLMLFLGLLPLSSPQSPAQRGTWSCCAPTTSRPGPAGSRPCACLRSESKIPI